MFGIGITWNTETKKSDWELKSSGTVHNYLPTPAALLVRADHATLMYINQPSHSMYSEKKCYQVNLKFIQPKLPLAWLWHSSEARSHPYSANCFSLYPLITIQPRQHYHLYCTAVSIGQTLLPVLCFAMGHGSCDGFPSLVKLSAVTSC